MCVVIVYRYIVVVIVSSSSTQCVVVISDVTNLDFMHSNSNQIIKNNSNGLKLKYIICMPRHLIILTNLMILSSYSS